MIFTNFPLFTRDCFSLPASSVNSGKVENENLCFLLKMEGWFAIIKEKVLNA